MLNATNLASVLVALRSGEYQQGRDCLLSGDRYCCLGVISELYRRETGKGIWKKSVAQAPRMAFYVDQEGSTLYLINPLHDWTGLSVAREATLTRMNDDGRTFMEIADQLEKWINEDIRMEAIDNLNEPY